MEDQRKGIEAKQDDMEIDLARLFSGIWKYFRRLWWLAFLLIIIGAAGFGFFQRTFHKPMYECSATFTVATGDGNSGSYSFYYDMNTADQMSLTFPYILESSFFQSRLLERLGQESLNGRISSETISGSNVVTMRVESPDAKSSYEILQAALEIYPETAHFVLGNIRFHMLDEPEMPQYPYNQMSLRRSLAIGGAGGLLTALVIFGLASMLSRTVQDPEEMKRITSLHCVAVLPHVRFKARKSGKDKRITILNERLSPGYRESVRALMGRVTKKLGEVEGKVLLVSSTTPGEGKSTAAVNLAQMIALSGKSVLLIDGDLRQPQDAYLLGVNGKYGLMDIARNESDKPAAQMVVKEKKSGVWFMGNQTSVRQPAAVLSSERVRKFIEYMREIMDCVIIDTPPCGMFQDAGLLAEYADGILYVVKYDHVSGQKIREGLSFLEERNKNFVGYIFNDYPAAAGNYGRYGYGRYGYGYYGSGKYGYGKKTGEKYEAAESGDDR